MAYVYSGRTFELLYRIPPPDATHAFGYGTGVDRRRQPRPRARPDRGRRRHRVRVLRPRRPTGSTRCRPQPRRGSSARSSWPASATSTTTTSRTSTAATTPPRDNGPGSGFAGVYSGRDGTLLRSWTGAAGDGLGPGRGAGDVNGDHRPDLAIGSYTNSDGAHGRGQDRALLRRDRREAAHDHVDDGGRATSASTRWGWATSTATIARPARLGGRGRHRLHDRGEAGGGARPGGRACAASGAAVHPGRRRRRGG